MTIMHTTYGEDQLMGFVVAGIEFWPFYWLSSSPLQHSRTYSASVWWKAIAKFNRSVSGSGNRHPIPGHRAPAVAMIGWHVARFRLWVPSAVGVINQMASTFERSVFLFFETISLVRVRIRIRVRGKFSYQLIIDSRMPVHDPPGSRSGYTGSRLNLKSTQRTNTVQYGDRQHCSTFDGENVKAADHSTTVSPWPHIYSASLWSQHTLFTLCHSGQTSFIIKSHSSLLPTWFTSCFEPASYITRNSSSKLFIPLSATFICSREIKETEARKFCEPIAVMRW